MRVARETFFETSDAARPRGHEPRVSVVVTNRDYGHFLSDCIQSVLAQTRAPDELIVVDDGSADASDAVLATVADRVEIVRLGRSRGQAAAFNEGYRRAAGDLVLFLDADDLLRPEAIEVVLAHAAPRYALVFFGLETVDADGRSTGLHYNSLEAEDGDNLPRLLRSGLNGGEFRFAPTSGNVFSRAFLEWALPMPEEAWRICADAYLVRAAQVWGPVRAIRRVLGAYRVHGGNNYVRSDNFGPWTMQRGERDLKTAAAALLSLADRAKLAAASPDCPRLRLALRLRALETLAGVAAWAGDARALRREARKTLAASLFGRLPLLERLAAAACLGRLACAGPSSPIVHALAGGERWPGRASARLHASLADLQRPRWLEPLPYDRMLDFRKPGVARRMLADGWSSHVPEQRYWSHGSRAALEFLLGPALGAVSVELSVRTAEACFDEELELSVASGPRRLWSGTIQGERTIGFTLERDAYLPEQPVRLEIGC
jgi:hypothetical protein